MGLNKFFFSITLNLAIFQNCNTTFTVLGDFYNLGCNSITSVNNKYYLKFKRVVLLF